MFCSSVAATPQAVLLQRKAAMCTPPDSNGASPMSNPVSRREFMNLLGATFGTGALVLSAGISGLTVARELSKVGHDVTVLESSYRAGGRIMTVRTGDVVDEIGNRQVCEWDNEPHMYFNAGAARIPSTHKNLLSYCKELGVDLEVFINESKTALIQDDAMLDGKPIRNADVSTNVRGFLGELFAKSFTTAQLEQPFTESEAETILGLIRGFGSLNRDMKYTGSNRNGYASGGETGPILMQPVGGMDRITAGFTRALGERVKYQTPVMSVKVRADGVDVVYLQDGAPQTIAADDFGNGMEFTRMTQAERVEWLLEGGEKLHPK
jgi:monoamine oxidase